MKEQHYEGSNVDIISYVTYAPSDIATNPSKWKLRIVMSNKD